MCLWCLKWSWLLKIVKEDIYGVFFRKKIGGGGDFVFKRVVRNY